MKKHIYSLLVWFIATSVLITACQPLFEAPLEAQIPGLVQTLAVQTMAADLALRPLLASPTQVPTQDSPNPTINNSNKAPTAPLQPTYTPLPSLTPSELVLEAAVTDASDQSISPSHPKETPVSVIQATAEPLEEHPVFIKGEDVTSTNPRLKDINPVNEEGKLCNQVQFVQDVTVPDETPMTPGEEFTKIWQVKNTGYCTWTPDYSLVVVWGDDMGTRPPVPLGQVVQPGQVADISIDMKAPYLPACYFTYWMLVDGRGNKFGTGSIAKGNIWVSVSVTIPYLEKYIRFG